MSIRKQIFSNGDWWTVIIGIEIFILTIITRAAGYSVKKIFPDLFLPLEWTRSLNFPHWPEYLISSFICFILSLVAVYVQLYYKKKHEGILINFSIGSLLTFGLTFISLLLGQFHALKQAGIEVTLLAFIFGILTTNLVVPLINIAFFSEPYHEAFRKPLPNILKVSSQSDWYIKIGLVLLAIDMQTIGSLGGPGLLSSWIDTPIVLILTYWFATKVVKMKDHSFCMMLAAGVSICGSSAATAVLSVVDGSETSLVFIVALLSLFTSVQMVALPYVAKALHLSEKVTGAWFGGAIDQTGSVVVAAEMFGGENTIKTAGLVKIIQNTLIGISAIFISIYWIKYETPSDDEDTESILSEEGSNEGPKRPKKISILKELWVRFPKFIIGFLLISLSLTLCKMFMHENDFNLIKSILSSICKIFFTLGFVGAGLETNFFALFKMVSNIGQPIMIYVFGQTLDLLLGFGMAYLAFEVI